MPKNTLVCFASWEDRCAMGIERTLKGGDVENVHLWYAVEYQEWTADARAKIRELSKECGSLYHEAAIKHTEPSKWWIQVQTEIQRIGRESESITFDYSTCPRDVVWCILSACSRVGSSCILNYYPPASYGDWLSADPESPMLIYGHSGIADPLRPTGLVVTSGYDLQRTAQICNVFEPEKMIVLLQSGERFQNVEKNLNVHMEWLNGNKDDRLSSREIDAYGVDRGQKALDSCISEMAESCNVVLASLGPKPGSIAMYKVWKERPECALVYVPSREYNRDYSTGISELLVDSI